MHMYLCVGVCTCVQVPSEARRGVRASGAGVTRDCELPAVGTENQSTIPQKTVDALLFPLSSSPAPKVVF